MNQGFSHRRKNLLTGEWVLVSPHRTQRPWQGLEEQAGTAAPGVYDPGCYLCPGNRRSSGITNPAYAGPWAFDNDYPALSGSSGEAQDGQEFFQVQPETGHCRVICYSPRHDRHLAGMDAAEIAAILKFLAGEFATLESETGAAYVQIFENRGEMMGCSNPHPHAQAWATSSLPNEPAKELASQLDYHQRTARPLLRDYLAAELDSGDRLVVADECAVSLVPFWATWPFETLLAPSGTAQGFTDMSEAQWDGFARILKQTLSAYDRLFGVPMPYSMGFHPRPSDGLDHPEWQFHAHIYPPLLRSATVRKFMVGFEMLGMPQRDLTPELAAARLRGVL